MYAVDDDRYCYRGTAVLKNKAGLRSQAGLSAFEAVMTADRFAEPLPPGRLGVGHYKALHRHIFQDVYIWAGRYRSVRISRGDSAFCYPENIPAQMQALFAALKHDRFLHDRLPEAFAAGAATFLATLNAIHPFRDGNGRTQTAFMLVIAARAGHPFAMERFEPEPFKSAMVASFLGDETPLTWQIGRLIG